MILIQHSFAKINFNLSIVIIRYLMTVSKQQSLSKANLDVVFEICKAANNRWSLEPSYTLAALTLRRYAHKTCNEAIGGSDGQMKRMDGLASCFLPILDIRCTP